MLIDDHINMQPENPLRGLNMEELGVRFPDMSQPYDAHLNQALKAIAQELEIPLHEGVYASVPGPNLETRAEYRFLRMAGADAVGMSTVPEVLVACHAGMEVFGLSAITDLGVPGKIHQVSLQDVIAAAALAEPVMSTLFEELVSRLAIKK